jgi:hypothetical protein
MGVERVRRVFATFDADRDGAISAQELLCAGLPLPAAAGAVGLAVERDGARGEKVEAEAFEGLARRLCALEGLGLREAL